jgi:hypothetical protein
MRFDPLASSSQRKIEKPSSLSVRFLAHGMGLRSAATSSLLRAKEAELTYFSRSCPRNSLMLLCSTAQLQERIAL